MRVLLTDLGFVIKEGKTPNHKIVTHSGLATFTTTSYDCGHGKDAAIKAPYVVKIARILGEFAEDLQKYLGEQK